MRKEKLIIVSFFLGAVILLAMPSRTLAQTSFPIGLMLDYRYYQPESPYNTEHHNEYEILNWNNTVRLDILEARTRTDYGTWYTIYFH